MWVFSKNTKPKPKPHDIHWGLHIGAAVGAQDGTPQLEQGRKESEARDHLRGLGSWLGARGQVPSLSGPQSFHVSNGGIGEGDL